MDFNFDLEIMNSRDEEVPFLTPMPLPITPRKDSQSSLSSPILQPFSLRQFQEESGEEESENSDEKEESENTALVSKWLGTHWSTTEHSNFTEEMYSDVVESSGSELYNSDTEEPEPIVWNPFLDTGDDSSVFSSGISEDIFDREDDDV